MMSGLSIGKIAKQAGVAIDTVRYYERMGLLPTPSRQLSGYRTYTPETVKRLQFIRRAKGLGFTLAEIAELLALSGPQADVGAIKTAAESKLVLVENKLRELQRVRDGLQSLIRHCPGHGAAQDCPILSALSEDLPS